MINPFRRAFLFGTAALATATTLRRANAQAVPQPVDLGAKLNYPFAVPPLPYGYDGNEPSIDAQTMQLHHDKHHAAYVSNLNAALKDHPDLHDVALKDLLARTQTLPEAIRTVVRNNAGGHANHTEGDSDPSGPGRPPDGPAWIAPARRARIPLLGHRRSRCGKRGGNAETPFFSRKSLMRVLIPA